MRFALFYRDKNVEMCGSDSFLPLDDRYTIEHSREIIEDIAKKHNLTSKGAKYYRIHIGTILNNRAITTYYKL